MNEKYIRANGIEIAYEEFGDPSHPVILLIMGLGTQMIAWPDALCNELAGNGFHVIRYDNRDIGLSEKMHNAKSTKLPLALILGRLGLPFKVAYTLDDMADDCVGLMNSLGIDQAHLVGASMGGMIGQLVTSRWPQRVISFTSIMSTSGGPEAPAASPKVTAALLRKAGANSDEIIQQRMEVLKMIGSKGPLAPDEDELREKITRSHKRSYHPAGYIRHIMAIARNGSRVGRLKNIQRPTLVIHGKADVLVPVEAGIDTARHIPGSRLELFDHMGHDLPKQLLSKFTEMISEHARVASAESN